MSVRKWYLSEALASVRRLNAVLNDLTLEEVTACLDLEVATQRRKTIINLLIDQAARIAAAEINNRLKEKYGY